ncbi:MAG: hypothetical protein ABI854_06475, partial [Betaproteobacteria bacterium]
MPLTMLPCRSICAVLCALLLVACGSRPPAPVVERPPTVPVPDYVQQPLGTSPSLGVPPPAPEKDWRPEFYTVKRGDT